MAEATVANNNGADPGYDGSAFGVPIILQYWNIFWRRRWLVLFIILGALFLGGVYISLATPQFSSEARLEISRQQAQVTNVRGIEAERTGQDLEFYASQHQLLAARSLAERVVRTLRLAQSEEFYAAHGQELNSGGLGTVAAQNMSAAQLKKMEDRAVRLLRRNMNIEPVRGSSLVDVRYVSADPSLSARIANTWAEQFIQASMDRRYASTAEARRFLEGRLTDLRERLDRSERELVNFAVARNIVTLTETQDGEGNTRSSETLTSSSLRDLNERLSQATADRIRFQNILAAMSSHRDNTGTLTNNAVNALRERRAEVAANLEAMLVQFEPAYPPAQALRRQLATIDAAIADEQRRNTSAAAADYRAAAGQESALRAQVDQLVSRLSQQERDGIQYTILQREVDTNRQLYDALLQRYKEIGVAGVSANNIAIVDRAIPAEQPSSPRVLLILFLAGLVGLGAAVLIAILLENLDEGVRDPTAVSQQLSVPVLGVIPDNDEEDVRAVIQDPKSDLSEAYSTMRSTLSFSTDHGVPATMMVTSTSEAEGKSTTAYATAIVLARSGKRVLLVDADMRLPTLDRYLGMKGIPGLSNYLAGDDNLASLIVETGQTNVWALTGGPIPPSAADLLGSDRLEQLIKVLEQQFDHVIVDCPPMLGLADTILISRAVEGVVYVIETSRVSVRGINTAINRLKAAKARVFGVVLTKYSTARSGYGYGYGYGYGDRYSYEYAEKSGS